MEGGVSVKFVLVEKRFLADITVLGNHFISENEILQTIPLKQGEEFTEARWEKALSAVTALYRSKGYFQVRLTMELRHRDEDRRKVDLTLQVSEGDRARIRNVQFTGERIFSDLTLTVQMISLLGGGSLKGEYYRFDVLEADLQRLQDFYEKEGYLKATVGPPVLEVVERTNEVDLTIPIAASNRVDLFFEGRTPFSEKQLRKFVLIKEERSDSDEILEESARQMEEFYRREGYPFAKVTVTSRRISEENRIEAHFQIKSGFRTRIEKIDFSGNHTFSRKRLQGVIRLKEEGPFTKSRFTQEQLDRDVVSLIQFYKKEGFRDPQVTSEVRFDPAMASATLLFKIDGGIRTRIGEVQLQGNQALSETQLKKELQIRSEMPYNETSAKEGARQLLAAYEKVGYPYASVNPSIRFSSDQTYADLTYEIIEGEQVRLGHITLDGNLRTHDDVLLREMALKEGDPYNVESILKSQRQLYRTGLFSVVHFDPIHPEAHPTVQDVQLRVVERPSIALDFGVGYANYERLLGFLEVSHRNLFGTGRSISARAEGSSIEKRYTLGYKEPWFIFPDTDAHVVAAYIDQKQTSFDLVRVSGSAGFDKSFSESLKGSFFYQYDRNRTSNVAAVAILTPDDTGKVNIASLNPSLILDTRDDPFNPRSGSVNGITVRDAARILGSEVQLVKVTLQSSWYQALSKRFVFAFSARTGVAWRFGETSDIPLPERFFVGGRSTVRGYDQNKLGVQGVTIINGEPTGGNAMLIFNEELRIALPQSFGLVLFFDHGNVWRGYRDIRFPDIKSTTGIGIRYNTPVGPFRLDWGYKLDRELGESPSAIHFTLGHAF